jgi:hypothetical protein
MGDNTCNLPHVFPTSLFMVAEHKVIVLGLYPHPLLLLAYCGNWLTTEDSAWWHGISAHRKHPLFLSPKEADTIKHLTSNNVLRNVQAHFYVGSCTAYAFPFQNKTWMTIIILVFSDRIPKTGCLTQQMFISHSEIWDV